MQSDQAGFTLTVLYLANTGLEVIQGHVADLIFEVGEIHGEGRLLVVRRSTEKRGSERKDDSSTGNWKPSTGRIRNPSGLTWTVGGGKMPGFQLATRLNAPRHVATPDQALYTSNGYNKRIFCLILLSTWIDSWKIEMFYD
jgi:hypothetical protein